MNLSFILFWFITRKYGNGNFVCHISKIVEKNGKRKIENTHISTFYILTRVVVPMFGGMFGRMGCKMHCTTIHNRYSRIRIRQFEWRIRIREQKYGSGPAWHFTLKHNDRYAEILPITLIPCFNLGIRAQRFNSGNNSAKKSQRECALCFVHEPAAILEPISVDERSKN